MPLEKTDYEQAARLFNKCRDSEATATPADMLICAVAQRYGAT